MYKVQLVYRNYKPLHSIFQSYIEDPPEGVEYLIPKVKSGGVLKYGFKIYRTFGRFPVVSDLIRQGQSLIFKPKLNLEADLIEYIQLIPDRRLQLPYIVDVEHVAGLFDFLQPTSQKADHISGFLSDRRCKAIICTSQAAKDTFNQYFSASQMEGFKEKLKVVYPSLRSYISEGYKADSEFIKKSDRLQLLFVGNDVYRKGLHELLEAVMMPEIIDRCDLHVISDADQALKDRYAHPHIHHYLPAFSHSDIITKFFRPADIFIMPTHSDSFGMVVLDSLSSGTPVVVTRQFATPELVEERVNGMFLRSERLYLKDNEVGEKPHFTKRVFEKDPEDLLVTEIRRVLEELIDHPELIEEMSKNSNELFEEGGKFSITRRNKQLSEIVAKAVGNE